ncbi:hypothetical protein BD626DRAFT_497835 [Schizophyllum amplum]|uniref:Uncharacterized protein n=1 Tax=Schizophyllum amplum TaxID=97359 RepID=A0A550CCN5_9AGAR|nr:hypothetical protein BD626DRAFT_497835 [Auriculariopsis ampla]
MSAPLHFVHGGAWPSKHSPRQLCCLIYDNSPAPPDPQRNHALRHCFVEEVVHYRRKAGSAHIPRELLVAQYSLDVMDESSVTVGKEYRVARFERLEENPSTIDAPSTVGVGATPVVGAYIRAALSMGSRTGNYDTITIENRLSPTIVRDYEPVASLRPAPGALRFADCAVAAHVITSRAPDYTPLQYDAMWYSCMVFMTLKAIAGSASDDGPARERAGRCGILRMVSAEGCPLLPERQRTMRQAADQVVNLLEQLPGLLGDGDEDAVGARDAFLDHSGKAEGAPVEPLQEVLLQVEALSTIMWEKMDEAARDAGERMDALVDEVSAVCAVCRGY